MTLPPLHLDALLGLGEGREDLPVAVIDGPVDTGHEGFGGRAFGTVPGGDGARCAVDDSFPCQHGTFVAGVIGGARGGGATGLAPACPLLLRPIFAEGLDGAGQAPLVTAEDLARALRDALAAGARLINLSLGLADTALEPSPALDAALDAARRQGVVVIAAAGNQGALGPVPLLAHPWILPVVACDAGGRPLPDATLGPSIGRNGLMAPGRAVPGLRAGGGTRTMTGSSVAAPVVTGIAALLWSQRPAASAAALVAALRSSAGPRRGVVPPLVDPARALAAL